MSQISTQVGKAVQRAAYPGLSPAMSQAFDLVMKGQQPDPNKFFTRRTKFYHRMDYATGGQAQLQFFNVAPSKWICNLPLQSQLAQEQAFKLEKIRIWPETGITAAATFTRAAAGSMIGGVAAAATGVATISTQITVAEELRTIFLGGAFTLRVGDKNVVDAMYSLNSFPQGGGMKLDGGFGVDSNSSTTGFNYDAALVLNNGDASVSNTYDLKPAYPILPGKTIYGLMEWQAALAVTTAFVVRVELDGVLVSPANN